MSNYCIQTNLPALTDEQNKTVIDTIYNTLGDIYRPVYSSGIPVQNTNGGYLYKKLELSQPGWYSIRDWEQKQNFVAEVLQPVMNFDIRKAVVGIQTTRGATLYPHRDDRRTCSLLYTVKGMGTTCFYEPTQGEPTGSFYAANHQTFELKETIRMNLNTWYLFNNQAIHSVEVDDKVERITLFITLSGLYANFNEAKNFFIVG